MSWTIALGLLVVAAALLAGGAELFAEHAASAGRRLGVTGLAVGLLLAGAEPEELITAVLAAARDQPGIAAGDSIGANVTLLTLIAGGLGLVSTVDLRGRARHYLLAAFGACLSAAAVAFDGSVSRIEGAGLILLYVVLVAAIWRREQDVPAIGELAEVFEDEDTDGGRSPAVGLVLALVGVAAMGSGGWLAVEGAERLVDLAGVGGTAVGLTAVALATTSEFLALIPATIRRGIPELAVAGIVGSVLYNATMTLGAAALVGTLVVDHISLPALAAAASMGVLTVLSRRYGSIPRPAAFVMLAAYVPYVVLVWRA